MTELKQTQRFFDDRAEIWDSHDYMEKEERLLEIFRNYISEPGYPLLDIGCGTGVLVPVLESILPKGSPIIEMDISRAMLAKAKSKYSLKNNISFTHANAHILPFTDNSIATVICFAVFPHLYDQKQAIKEFYRILAKDGSLVILHLMGHKELNAMHSEAGHAVCRHALAPADTVARQISEQNFTITTCEEDENLYLIEAEKYGD
jgi:ubiquinone/menaquinone biosynthesis C-methylase UbiE